MTWHPDMPDEYKNQIVTGDARVLAERVPDESVDLIFTDPPYLKEFLPLYGWLAETADRILVPGGSCIALVGHEHLYRVMMDMGRFLDYHWMCCLWQPGSSGLIWYKSIMAKWKPAIWFSKGSPTAMVRRWFMDGVEGTQSKAFHLWGQPVAWARWIDRIDAPVTFDPFVGGGTVPAVCKQLNRNYIAFEIDPATAAVARERVANTQPPLFVPEPEQLSLDLDADR